MNTSHFAGPGRPAESADSAESPDRATADVVRVADDQWHALADDLVVGRADAVRRPDGRLFVSVDAWQADVFDRLVRVLAAELPAPLHVVVDEADLEALDGWRRNGFSELRREWGYAVPTDPRVTGLGTVRPPAGVTILPVGSAATEPLQDLDRMIRAEVAAGPGWHTMPVEVPPPPIGGAGSDRAKYAVAAEGDQYVGLLRLASAGRRNRIGLLAVRADRQRRGIARALLAQVLGSLHEAGAATAFADVDETNHAAVTLFEGVGAARVGSLLELVGR